MPGRRREQRYRLSKPFEGSLVFFQEVDVERRDEREVSALSDAPMQSGQNVKLDLVGSTPRSTLRVQVAESTPVIVEGKMRYRLRFLILA